MRKIFLSGQLPTFLAALALFVAVSASARGDDRFILAFGARDTLVVFGPKGETTEIPAPTIAKQVTVGDTTVQISFGRNAKNLLTAVVAPDDEEPKSLHFSVLKQNVDTSSHAVVTLTFQDRDHVTIDPGYLGSVEVNSHLIKRHSLTDK